MPTLHKKQGKQALRSKRSKRGDDFSFLDNLSLQGERIHLLCTERIRQDAIYGVPRYRFSIVENTTGSIVGHCDLRVGFHSHLYYSGHIGYGINEAYRGHGYAGEACLLLLELAKRHHMPQVIITCRPDNLASVRTCERLGARPLGLVDVPTDHDLYRDGDRILCRYGFFFDEFR